MKVEVAYHLAHAILSTTFGHNTLEFWHGAVASGAEGDVSGTLKDVLLVDCVKDNKRSKFIDLWSIRVRINVLD